ncbi:MAG: cation-transporting P-type ATPase, partial [Deltaproteobacteria bacterium]|nr:cation-transporting P-type ATPase [Deltaproteobacteria bacterium]
MEYEHAPIENVLQELQTTADGLTTEEAARRLQQESSARQPQPAARFNRHLLPWPVMALFPFAAALLALRVSDFGPVDALLLFIVLSASLIFEILRRARASRLQEKFAREDSLSIRTLRDGRTSEIDVRELVPGDIITLESGDFVPVDARLLEAENLKVDESARGGNAAPVEKSAELSAHEEEHQACMLFQGSAILTGKAKAVVIDASAQTQFAPAEEADPLPFAQKLRRVVRLGFGWSAIVFAVLALCAGYLLKNSSGKAFLCLILAAGVPAALSFALDFILRNGLRHMRRQGLKIRNLATLEHLEGCDILCTGKTGTLTENAMMVRHIWTPDGEARLDGTGCNPTGDVEGAVSPLLLRCGLFCNNARLCREDYEWKIEGDQVEGALLAAAARAGVSASGQRLAEIPFDPLRKMMSVQVEEEKGAVTIYSKGALESVLAACSHILTDGWELPLTEEMRAELIRRHDLYASQGLHVLAFARKKSARNEAITESGLTFIGLQALEDPLRPETVPALREAWEAGLRVVLLSADSRATAQAVGAAAGIYGGALGGDEIAAMTNEELRMALAPNHNINIFFRMTPQMKGRIVATLREMGHNVAMQGSRADDFAALHGATTGLAAQNGAAAAREAAQVMLPSESIAQGLAALRLGHTVCESIRKTIMLLFACHLLEMLLLAGAALFGAAPPLNVRLLLWLNLPIFGLLALALCYNPGSAGTMSRVPLAKSLLPPSRLAPLTLMAVLGAAIALFLFRHIAGDANALPLARGMTSGFVALAAIILATKIRHACHEKLLTKRWMVALALCLVLQGLVLCTGLARFFQAAVPSPAQLAMLAA